jgi:hypothetical protein
MLQIYNSTTICNLVWKLACWTRAQMVIRSYPSLIQNFYIDNRKFIHYISHNTAIFFEDYTIFILCDMFLLFSHHQANYHSHTNITIWKLLLKLIYNILRMFWIIWYKISHWIGIKNIKDNGKYKNGEIPQLYWQYISFWRCSVLFVFIP